MKRNNFMKRIMKTAVSLCTAAVFIFPCTALSVQHITAIAEEAFAESAGGTYENLSWSIDDGVLTISGEGEMAVDSTLEMMEASNYPWNAYEYVSIVVEEGVTSISESAFAYSSAVEISLPETLTYIGSLAFDSSKIINITIPESVQSIGEAVFVQSDIKRAVINAQITELPEISFLHTNLEEITLPDGLTTIGENAFLGCDKLKKVNIPESVTYIGVRAFSHCMSIEKYDLPDGLTYIGGGAFEYNSITELTVPDSVTEYGAFIMDCTELKELVLPEGFFSESIPKYFFQNCKYLDASVYLTEGITDIGAYAFNGCSSMTSITIPDSVSSIGDGVFKGCSSLEYVKCSNNITSIPFQAFYGCASLETCILPDSLATIKQDAFSYSGITEIEFPEGLEAIEFYAFDTLNPISNVVLPDSVTSIYGSSFTNAESLTLGASVKITSGSISSDKTKRLDNIYVSPDNPYYEAEDGILYDKGKTTIIDFAATHTFENDTYFIPDTVTSIGKPIRCQTFRNYAVSTENERFSTIDGVLTDKSGTKLVSYPYGRKDKVYTVPDTIETIGESAFEGTHVEYVIFPDSLKTIESKAFQNGSLKGFDASPSIEYVGKYAFNNGKISYIELESMSGNSDPYAFYARVIKLPEGSEFTLGRSDIIRVYGDETAGEVSVSGTYGEFTWEIRNKTLIIAGNGEMVKSAEYPWHDNEFYKVKFIGENITIPDNVFAGLNNLCVLDLGEGVVSIGAGAFSSCNALTYVSGGENVSFVGKDAFLNTKWVGSSVLNNLNDETENMCRLGSVCVCVEPEQESAAFPDTIDFIADGALKGCKNLKTIYISRNGWEFSEDVFSDCISIENICWCDTGERITLNEFQEMAQSCEISTFTNNNGEEVTGKTVYSINNILTLVNAMKLTPFEEDLSREYCHNIINEIGINEDMTDEELIQMFFDYLMKTTEYGFTYIEDPYGIYQSNEISFSMCSLFSHESTGLAIMKSGVCSSYSELFKVYAEVLAKEGISTTITAMENFGAGHQWNVIGLDTGTENERWYYHDASNGQCLIGYENGILKSNPEMFAYDGDIPENEDGTYTITLKDGTLINLQGEDAERNVLTGDADGNGSVDISDAVLVLKVYAQKAADLTPDEGYTDTDGDGVTEIGDASAILTYYAMSAADIPVSWEDIFKKAE